MPTTRHCAECGTPLPDEVPEGACPVCALRGALELPDVSSQAAVTEKPGDRIGRYKLLEKIGEGGCGIVYMAEQTEPIRRRVALKVIKLGMDTRQVVARFEAERQALALMDHPNIAKVLDAGATDTGRPYFVMELVRGIKITDYCDQHSLSTGERLDLFRQVCYAVQHAHQKGIIHRDLKPSNILVTELDGLPVPKVIDFGIAKATQQPLTDKTLFTGFQQSMGTPAYMSPEQAGMSGADIDTRSDIYALGVLLYELVTGHVPFEKEELLQAGLEEMRRLIREKEPLKPSTRLRSLSAEDLTTVAKHQCTEPPKLLHLVRGDLDWIVMKCLEKDRNRRYETANGLASDLVRHVNSEPVVARPQSNAYRFQKMVRRNKLVFAAGTAVGAAVLVGLAVSTFLFIQERRAHDRALVAEHEQSQSRKEAEAEAKKAKSEAERAEAAATEVRMTLAAADFSQAVRLIAEDDRPDALAFLARSLAANPTNAAALTRLTTLLTYHSWPLPTTGAMKHNGGVLSAQFSPDGKWIVTVSTNTVQVWDAQTCQPLTEPMMHNGIVRLAQFSPDGKRILTTSTDKTVRVWDAQTGQPLAEPMKHETWVTSAQFSPDGKWIVTASTNSVQVWDAQSGQPLTEPMKHDGDVSSAQFSSDGKRIVTVSCDLPSAVWNTQWTDRVARVWDAQSGQLLTELLKHDIKVNSMQFSPDGKRIVTTSGDNSARVWDAQSGQPLTQPMKHDDFVSSAQFSPDGKRILTVSYDNKARVWDAQSGQLLTEPLKHSDKVNSAQFSSDGKRIVTASSDNTARVWDAQTGQPLSEPMRHSGEVLSAQLSSDGKRVVTVWFDNRARVSDAQSGQLLTEPMKHSGKVWSAARLSSDGERSVTALFLSDNTARVCDMQVWDLQGSEAFTETMEHNSDLLLAQFSPDGERILTLSTNEVRVWDAQTGQPLTEPMQHRLGLVSAQFSPDGKRILTACGPLFGEGGAAQVWDAQTGQPLTEPMQHKLGLVSAQFSPDGKRILTVCGSWFGGGGAAQVWDAQTGQPVAGPLNHDEDVSSAQFSPDGKRIVTASSDNTARVWDAQTGQPLTNPMEHDNSVYSAQFSPDGKRILTTSADDTARVWDAQSGRPLTEPMKHNRMVLSAQFSPDGNRIVTASEDDTVRVWDAQSGQPLTEPMKHSGKVWSAQFSPDGKLIVTASPDRTARVWDAQTGQPLTEPMRHNGMVLSAQFSPDGKRIVTADGTARVWDIAPSGRGFPDWLLPLAEALSGKRLNRLGVLEATGQDLATVIGRIRQQLEQAHGNDDWVVWGRWFLADRTTRTISPFSKVTLPEYRQRQGTH